MSSGAHDRHEAQLDNGMSGTILAGVVGIRLNDLQADFFVCCLFDRSGRVTTQQLDQKSFKITFFDICELEPRDAPLRSVRAANAGASECVYLNTRLIHGCNPNISHV